MSGFRLIVMGLGQGKLDPSLSKETFHGKSDPSFSKEIF